MHILATIFNEDDLFHTGVKCPGGAPHKFGGHDAPGYPPLYLGPSWRVFSKKNKKSKTWILLTNAMQLPGGSAPRSFFSKRLNFV